MSEQTTGKLSDWQLAEMRRHFTTLTYPSSDPTGFGKRLIGHIGYQDAKIERLTKELGEATAKLDSLKLDPAKREEFIVECHGRFQAGFLEEYRFVWRAHGEQFRAGFAAAIDHAFAAGRASAPEVAELQRQLKEATKRLAELTKGADDDMGQLIWETFCRAMNNGHLSSKWDEVKKTLQDAYRQMADAVAARVRAPLLQQIAELKTALDFSNATREQADHEIEVLQKQAESSNQGTAASCVGGSEAVLETEEGRGECPECHYQAWVISAETGKVLFCKVCDEASQKRDALQMERELRADRDRLAAELGEAKQALATLTDERDRARDALRQAEAGVAAVQQALAEARAQMERLVRFKDAAIAFDADMPPMARIFVPQFGALCSAWKRLERERANAAPLTAAEFAELCKVLDAEAKSGSVEQFLAENPPAKEFTPYVYAPESGGLRAHWKPDADRLDGTYEHRGITLYRSLETNEIVGCGLAEPGHSLDAAEKVEPQASEARQFVCPKCGGHFCERRADGSTRCLGVGVLAWSGCPASASPEPGSMKVESGAGEGESAKGEQSEHKTPELIFSAGPLRNACQAGWHSARGEASLVYPCAVAARNEAQKIVDEAKEARDARARLGIVPGSSETLREKVDGLRQQLAAERQAREANARRATEKILELERRCNDEHRKCEAAEQRAEQAEAAAGANAKVIQDALELYKAADEERLNEQKEANNESAKWRAEGDMYGCNFHQGKAGGMNEASIVFYRVHRFLEKALATDAGRAAPNELRALRAFRAEIEQDYQAWANATIGEAELRIRLGVARNKVDKAIAGQGETGKEGR